MHRAACGLPLESHAGEQRNGDFTVHGIYQNKKNNENEHLRELLLGVINALEKDNKDQE